MDESVREERDVEKLTVGATALTGIGSETVGTVGAGSALVASGAVEYETRSFTKSDGRTRDRLCLFDGNLSKDEHA